MYRKRRTLSPDERARQIILLNLFIPKNATEERDKKILEYFLIDGMSTQEIYDKHGSEIRCLGNRGKGKPLTINSMSVIIRKYIPQAAYQDWHRKKTVTEKIRMEHTINKKKGKTSEHVRQCAFCGSKDHLEEHHMIPVRMCGTNDERNLVYLCHDCHLDVTRYQNEILKEGANGSS